jgi:hypothetical protein
VPHPATRAVNAALPEEVNNLLEVVASKQLCRAAGVERVGAVPKGAVIAFRNNVFANPGALVSFIAGQGAAFKLRPDHRLVYRRKWETPADRLTGLRELRAREECSSRMRIMGSGPRSYIARRSRPLHLHLACGNSVNGRMSPERVLGKVSSIPCERCDRDGCWITIVADLRSHKYPFCNMLA